MKKILIGFIAIGLLTFAGCSKDEGCTDILATNYDSEAEEDDGSCTYAATTTTSTGSTSGGETTGGTTSSYTGSSTYYLSGTVSGESLLMETSGDYTTGPAYDILIGPWNEDSARYDVESYSAGGSISSGYPLFETVRIMFYTNPSLYLPCERIMEEYKSQSFIYHDADNENYAANPVVVSIFYQDKNGINWSSSYTTNSSSQFQISESTKITSSSRETNYQTGYKLEGSFSCELMNESQDSTIQFSNFSYSIVATDCEY
tara:strand:- start:289 stop:1068 length:780 start_codon:yes stop_codon:yes gene_type:complete